MRISVVCLCSFFVLLFSFSGPAQADELSEISAQMKTMQREIQEQAREIEYQKRQIEAMQKELDELKAKRSAKTEPRATMEERWEIGGELEFEFVDTQKHVSVNEPEAHFQLDKFMLIPKVYLTDDSYLYSEIEFYSSSMLTKYIYAHFGSLPLDSFVRIGFDQRFMQPSRKTERYPLAGNSFWRDNSAGIYVGGPLDPLYWRFSYTNGYEMNQREVTEDNSLDMLHDNLKTSSYASPGEAGFGLGLKKDCDSLGRFDTMGFFYFGRLSGADEAFLNNNVTGYSSKERDRYRYGGNFNYSLSNANLFAHFIQARDGDMDRYSWYIQPSYKIDLARLWGQPERKFLYAVEPLFRYGQLCITNVDSVLNDPLTWDREEFTLALLTSLYQNIILKTEYSIDRMDKGSGGEKDYGEFMAQLEIKF